MCPFCPDTTLDPSWSSCCDMQAGGGGGGDVVICHNCSRDEIFDLCRLTHLTVSVERGIGFTKDLDHTTFL